MTAIATLRAIPSLRTSRVVNEKESPSFRRKLKFAGKRTPDSQGLSGGFGEVMIRIVFQDLLSHGSAALTKPRPHRQRQLQVHPRHFRKLCNTRSLHAKRPRPTAGAWSRSFSHYAGHQKSSLVDAAWGNTSPSKELAPDPFLLSCAFGGIIESRLCRFQHC